MSRLSDCQISAQIRGLEATIRMYEDRGRPMLARRAQIKLRDYMAELAARERGEAVQEPQQDRRHA